jgi:NAD(P)-dependent dehydrogenase (short-subunit alcohol dehydrogenase family)
VSAGAAAADLNRVGVTAVGITMDVTNEAQVEAGVASAAASFGRLNILVSNAGIPIVAPLDQMAFSDWKRLLAIHLEGAFLTTRAALRQMSALGMSAKGQLRKSSLAPDFDCFLTHLFVVPKFSCLELAFSDRDTIFQPREHIQ